MPRIEELKKWWGSESGTRRRNAFVEILELIWRERPMAGEVLVRGILADGEISGRPYDVSSLSVALEQPRTSVTRLINYLEKGDVVECRMKGRRKEIFLTEKGWCQMKDLWDRVDAMLDHFMAREMGA